MYLTNLSLQKFRNYRKKSFDFSSNTTLIVGDNGVGKTNVLEAIYLLATGKSFRATREDQMIFYGEELGRVEAEIEDSPEEERIDLEVMMTVGEVAGKKAPRKRYLINGLGKRKMDFVGRLKCVLFRPEDIDLVLGSPSGRREYLDSVLEQVDSEYRRSNLSYQKGLRQRNKLLEKIREGEAERKQLLFWDQMVIKNGEKISDKRGEYLEKVSEDLKKRGMDLRLMYDKSIISPARLKKYADREVWAGRTLVGPHRDDFEFIVKRKGKLEKNLSFYGSRGEQRMAVLGVKLAELKFVKERVEEAPVLLLDDVFSELDDEHRKEIFKLLDKQQTIVTTADEKLMPVKYKSKVEMIKLG